MSLKAERIHAARRTAIRNRLTDTGTDLGVAERWCDAWEAEAARQGLAQSSAYWDVGKLWIDEQCAARKRPPN
jgi:hypothetical protein